MPRRSWLLATSVATAAGVFSLALTPGLASADPPPREPVVVESPQVFRAADGSDPCGFQVQLEVLTNKATLTTFERRNGVTVVHAAGALKVRLTRLPDGPSIDRNISGPTMLTFNADGSVTQKTAGPGLWAFDVGVAQDLPRMAITKGKTESSFSPEGAFTFLGQRGAVEDVCAALA
jgi:hypothetical protein